MPLELQEKSPPRLSAGAWYALALAGFVLIVAFQLVFSTLTVREAALAPLPLLQAGESCNLSLTVTYDLPTGLPAFVEEGLVQVKKSTLHPVYTVADPTVASVTADGKVTALQDGVTEVSVTLGGITQSVELVVGGTPVEALELVLFTHRIDVGTTIVPGLHVLPAEADAYTEVTLTSSDESILRPNVDGSFTALAPGMVQLEAVTYSARRIVCTETIYVTE